MALTSHESSRKVLYKGTFNWHGEVFVLHKRAHSALQAYRIMCTDIAHKVGLSSWAIRQYFSPDTDHYTVEPLLDNLAKNGYNKKKKEKGANDESSRVSEAVSATEEGHPR